MRSLSPSLIILFAGLAVMSSCKKAKPSIPQPTAEQTPSNQPESQTVEPTLQPKAEPNPASIKETKETKRPAIKPPIIRPDSAAYTVQLGAYVREKDARRFEEKMKERFKDNPVIVTNLEPVFRMYRVSIGKFESKKDASALRSEVMSKYPKEHGDAWVNYTSR